MIHSDVESEKRTNKKQSKKNTLKYKELVVVGEGSDRCWIKSVKNTNL